MLPSKIVVSEKTWNACKHSVNIGKVNWMVPVQKNPNTLTHKAPSACPLYMSNESKQATRKWSHWNIHLQQSSFSTHRVNEQQLQRNRPSRTKKENNRIHEEEKESTITKASLGSAHTHTQSNHPPFMYWSRSQACKYGEQAKGNHHQKEIKEGTSKTITQTPKKETERSGQKQQENGG